MLIDFSPEILFIFRSAGCPPCKAFSPLLVSFYNNCAKDGKIEVVFVSSDRSVQSFNEYYDKMPWLAIPADAGAAQIKSQLAKALKISGIPALIVLDAKTGQFVTSDARTEVTNVGDDKNKGRDLIASWKQKDTIPLDELSGGIDTPNKGIGAALLGLVMLM